MGREGGREEGRKGGREEGRKGGRGGRGKGGEREREREREREGGRLVTVPCLLVHVQKRTLTDKSKRRM